MTTSGQQGLISQSKPGCGRGVRQTTYIEPTGEQLAGLWQKICIHKTMQTGRKYSETINLRDTILTRKNITWFIRVADEAIADRA